MKISNLYKGLILSIICIVVVTLNYYNSPSWINIILSILTFYLGFGVGWNYRIDFERYTSKKDENK